MRALTDFLRPALRPALCSAAVSMLLAASSLPAHAATGSAARARCESSRPIASPAAPSARTDSVWSTLFESGQSFADFLAATKARREGWHARTDSVRLDPTMLARARAVGGEWRILVVAIDRCGDSMNSVPYLARLADSVPGLSLRIVLPEPGRAAQDAHKSVDGRRATPTFVLLDASGTSRGCIVELPKEIRDWAHGVRGAVSSDSLHAGIAAYYRRNQGQGIVQEAVTMLEAARRGERHCARG